MPTWWRTAVGFGHDFAAEPDWAQRERQLERAVLAQAEAAYVRFVKARQRTDAVATNGERLGLAKAEPGKAARRSQIPKPPPFATGSTASGSTIRRR